MAKFKAARKLFKFKTKTKLAFLGMGAVTGGVLGGARAEPGLKTAGAKYGAVSGGLIGGLAAFSPSLARATGRAIKAETKLATRGIRRGARYSYLKKYRKGQMIFRRIRGRIVPIRVKK